MSIETLQKYGLETMDDDQIRRFLQTQNSGVLGLPTEGSPYMIPLSYAFDGDSKLYFTYLLGPSSEKESLSQRVGQARFLVYAVETLFNWRSVMLDGTLTEKPESEWDEIEHLLENVWRPDILQTATTDGSVKIYECTVEEQAGIRHSGLAPGFRDGVDQEESTDER